MADGVAGSNSDRWNWQLCCLQPIGDSPPAEGAKQDSDSISHAGKSDDLGVSEWYCATRKFGQCQSQNLWCLKAVAG